MSGERREIINTTHSILEEEADKTRHVREPSDVAVTPMETQSLWLQGNEIPTREMVRGAVAMKEDKAYFVNKDGEMWLYDSSDGTWSIDRRCPREYTSLVVINGLLTAVGGLDNRGLANCITNTLLSLTGEGEIKRWEEKFPPMSTPRYFTATATTTNHLIVAGGIASVRRKFGITRNENQSAVEVLNTNSLVWSLVASMPQPYSKMSASVCRDKLYLLGGVNSKSKTLHVIACSLANLLESNETVTSGVWDKLNDVPNYYSTCATVNGELFVVGGLSKQRKSVNQVYKYVQANGTWKKVTDSLTPRQYSLIATFPLKSMMVVVGGYRDKDYCTTTDIWQTA